MSVTQHSVQAPTETPKASALTAELSRRALMIDGFDELSVVLAPDQRRPWHRQISDDDGQLVIENNRRDTIYCPRG